MRVTVACILVHLQKYPIKMCLTAFTYAPLDLILNLPPPLTHNFHLTTSTFFIFKSGIKPPSLFIGDNVPVVPASLTEMEEKQFLPIHCL